MKIIDDTESICTVNNYGTKIWINKDGKIHREGNQPAIEYVDGYKAWYINGELHRDNDEPAAEDHGYKAWFKNGSRHRVKGAAIEYPNGTKSWYLNDKYIECKSQKEFKKYLLILTFK